MLVSGCWSCGAPLMGYRLHRGALTQTKESIPTQIVQVRKGDMSASGAGWAQNKDTAHKTTNFTEKLAFSRNGQLS